MKIKLDALDKLFSLYIRSRDKVCQRCGGKAQHSAHFHGRSRRSVRWDEDNCCALCFGCHQYLDSHPLEKVEFFKSRLGEDKFDMLNSRMRSMEKVDKKLLTLYYQNKIKLLEEGNNELET